MAARWANRATASLMIVFAFVALVTVSTAFLSAPKPLPADEGTGAHIFQLSIAVGIAFALLYYLEHFYLY